MFDQIHPVSNDADPYATLGDIYAMQDVPEVDVKIVRWTASGKALKLRVRGLSLPVQEKIQQAALVKNQKTGVWEQSRTQFVIESLQQIVKVPTIDKTAAQLMLDKNPLVINALVDFGWALVAFTDDELEKAAHALLPDPAALASEGDAPSTDDDPLA
jgi:hypothetical protein